MSFATLVETLGTPYSKLLEIDLEREPFKWLLASVLFGARISEKIAINTYREFEKEGLTSPIAILNRGWNGLVEVLDKGGYVRYDFKTADKLLALCKNLTEKYGDLNEVHNNAKNSKELETMLKDLAKGIGDVTVNIFLREMRNIWKKADPKLQEFVTVAARNLGIENINDFWKEHLRNIQFSSWEIALLRLGKDFCRKKKCTLCIVKEICKIGK